MKQKIFTLLMMLALMVVAGSAMAANETQVYRGGTYTYNLAGISVAGSDAGVTFSHDLDASAVYTMTAGFTGVGPYVAPIGTNYVGSFTIKFSAGATVGSGTLNVTITYPSGGCSNFITYGIEIVADPTYVLNIVPVPGAYTECQVRAGSGNNAPNATVVTNDETNTFTFEVRPTIDHIISGSSYTYNYKISCADNALLNSFNIASGPSSAELVYAGETVTHTTVADPTGLTADVFTVTFNTTTGITAQDIVASLSATAGDAVLTVLGGAKANASFINSSATVRAGAVPSIGKFQ